VAAAAVRGVAGIGLELRLQYDGELRRLQVFRVVGELQARALEKRAELAARGWTAPGEVKTDV
jgi:hypothetical protein